MRYDTLCWYIGIVAIAIGLTTESGCKPRTNKAENFAKAIDPTALCTIISTADSDHCSANDIATCRVGHELWLCTVDSTGDHKPSCEKIRDLPAEKAQ